MSDNNKYTKEESVQMEDIKILAVVEFNDHEAFVLNRNPVFKYKRLGEDYLYAEDSGFYNCFYYQTPDDRWKAFGGRKFNLNMDDGSIIECFGQWWDGGYSEIANMEKIELCHVTYDSLSSLQSCYVFTGTSMEREAYQKLRGKYKGCVYPYRDYEKIIKYEVLWKKIHKLSWAKRSLVKEVKRLSGIIKKVN